MKSIAQRVEDLNISYTTITRVEERDHWAYELWHPAADQVLYTCRVSNGDSFDTLDMTLFQHQSAAAPTLVEFFDLTRTVALGIHSNLSGEEEESFRSWCYEFDRNTDSRAAWREWEEQCRIREYLRSWLGNRLFNEWMSEETYGL